MQYLLIGLFCFVSFQHAVAREKPALFEWGFFMAHGGLTDYPASDEYRYRTLPAPYLNYRGDVLRSDEQDGTRLRMIKDPDFDFDFSFGGSFPTETDNNQARLNMPELDWTLEFGPRLLYYFYKNETGNLRLGLPVRTAFATDFTRWSQLGYIFAPTLQLDLYDVYVDKLNLYLMFNLNYLTERQADFFFQIDSIYQTPQRSAYDAKAGFLSHDTSLALKYEWDNKLIMLAAEYSDFSASANNLSYLHRTNINWSYFVGFGWLLFKSEERAPD